MVPKNICCAVVWCCACTSVGGGFTLARYREIGRSLIQSQHKVSPTAPNCSSSHSSTDSVVAPLWVHMLSPPSLSSVTARFNVQLGLGGGRRLNHSQSALSSPATGTNSKTMMDRILCFITKTLPRKFLVGRNSQSQTVCTYKLIQDNKSSICHMRYQLKTPIALSNDNRVPQVSLT